MKLLFKFHDQTGSDARLEVIRVLGEHGVAGIRALFPDETDAELLSLYVVEGMQDDAHQELLDLLDSFEVIEHVEAQPERKLIK